MEIVAPLAWLLLLIRTATEAFRPITSPARIVPVVPTSGRVVRRAATPSSPDNVSDIGQPNTADANNKRINGRAADIPDLVFPQTANTAPNPSGLESVVTNAKSLLTVGSSAKAQRKYIKATFSGMTVALAMVPEAIAYSFMAGVNPLVGLWTTVTHGLTAGTLTARAGIPSGCSGACSMAVATLSASMGPAYLPACAMLAGVLQLAMGAANVGRFIRLVPHPVMLGFVNGIAVLIGYAQLKHFKGIPFFSKTGYSTYGIMALTMAVAKLFPKLTKLIPGTLVGVMVATVVKTIFKLPVTTLADVAGASTFTGGWSVLPSLTWPSVPITLGTLKIIFPYALAMAAVGALESLLTLQLLDGIMDDGHRGSTKQEMCAQGTGNIVSGAFGGMGGCALLGQALVNVEAGGGVSRWSGMSMAIILGLGIVSAAPLLGSVPISALVGVMLLVCRSTFSWSSLRIINKIPRMDALVIALTSVTLVTKDILLAVVAGTIASCLTFAWKQSTKLVAQTAYEGNVKHYKMSGPLFFASTLSFRELFDVRDDPDTIVLDFESSRVVDHAAIDAIYSLAKAYGEAGKTIYLRRLSKDCTQILAKMNSSSEVPSYKVVNDPASDPVYGIADSPAFYNNLAV